MQNSPSATRVAQRAIVLLSVAYRGLLERDVNQPDTPKFLAEVMPWLELTGAATELEPAERASIETPLGTLTEQAASQLVWQLEASGMLAWALGRMDLPALYQQAEPGPVARALAFLAPAEKTPIFNAALRPASEIETLTNRHLTAHWRLRDYRIRPHKMNFRSFVEECKWGPLSLDGLDLEQDELVVDGLRIDSYNPDDLLGSTGVIAERHHALNWLMGNEKLYSEVDTAT